MKLLLITFTLGLLDSVYGQTYQALEKTLAKELPENSIKDGRWVFYSDRAEIKKIARPLIKSVAPTYDLYEVTLTNYLGWHVNQGICMVLFDSTNLKIVLVEPLWYGGISEPLLKLFIGHKFNSKDSILTFLTELNELMQIGSGYKFRYASYSDNSITYDLGHFKSDTYNTGGSGATTMIRYNDDGVWRKIIIDTKDLAIIRYTSINPKTNDRVVIE